MSKKQKLPPAVDPITTEFDIDSNDSVLSNDQLRLAVYHLMTVLYYGGVNEIHLGGLMRILGVTNEAAAAHDQEIVIMSDEAAAFVQSLLDQHAQQLNNETAETEEVDATDLHKVTLH